MIDRKAPDPLDLAQLRTFPAVYRAGALSAAAVVPGLGSLTAAGVRLRIDLGLADDLLAGLRTGAYDLVVSSIRPRSRALVAEPLGDEDYPSPHVTLVRNHLLRLAKAP